MCFINNIQKVLEIFNSKHTRNCGQGFLGLIISTITQWIPVFEFFTIQQ